MCVQRLHLLAAPVSRSDLALNEHLDSVVYLRV